MKLIILFYTSRTNRTSKPNAEADKERLLKRVSFDLTGLPPAIGNDG